MGKFSSYAVRANETAKELLTKMQEAEAAFVAAENAKKTVNRADPLAVALADARYQKAKAEFDSSRRNLPETGLRELRKIRGELSDAIKNSFLVDPNEVDINTLKILESGICKSADFERLLENADAAGSATMRRLIASFAKKAAENMEENGLNSAERAKLYAIGQHSAEATENSLLGAYDVIVEAFSCSMSNLGMVDHWSEMTDDIVNVF